MEKGKPAGRPAPYVPWRTFTNFLDRLENEDHLPARIDRSYLRGMSGADQSQLVVTLRALRLIGQNNELLPRLELLAKKPDERPQELAEILSAFYKHQVTLGNRATQRQLEDSFEEDFGARGSTKQRAIRFFLNGAEYAGLQLSPHFKAPAAPRGRASSRRRPVQANERRGDEGAPLDRDNGPKGMTHTVSLRSGGELTLSLSANLFALSEADEEFVMGLVRAVRGYSARSKADPDKSRDSV